MRGGEEATTEAYPGYAAGRSDRANEAEGSSSPTPSANSTVELGRNRSGSGDEEGPRCEAAPDGRTRGVLAVRRACGRGRQRSRWALIVSRQGVAVLDGEVAVPCNPQSATAGLNSLSRTAGVE